MKINRSGYYKWINRQKAFNICPQKALRATRMNLFKKYGEKYRTHGYRWLNAKIRLDINDFKCSDETARQICKYLGIKSKSKHEKQKYRKPRKDAKNYQNLILNQIAPEEPFNVVVSDMTVMKHRGEYHKVTFYMEFSDWKSNKEITLNSVLNDAKNMREVIITFLDEDEASHLESNTVTIKR